MGGVFGFDANKTNSETKTYNLQATSQYGTAQSGSTDQAIGTNGAGIGGKSKLSAKGGKGDNSGNVITNITNTTLDADVAKAALSSNSSVGIAALQSQQALSTLAVGYASQNATMALQTLQSLGQNQQVANAGGTAADVLDSASINSNNATSALKQVSKPFVVITVAIVLVVGGYFIYKNS